MITTKDLAGIATRSIPYGQPEEVVVEPRKELPDEFRDKHNQKFEQPEVYVLDNVELAGPVLVGFRDGDVLLDTAYHGRIDILERNRPYFLWATDIRRNCEPVRIKRAVSLTCVWASNYFHWFLEILPKLEGIIKFLETEPSQLTILVEHNVPAFVIQSLLRLGFQMSDICPIERPFYYKVDELLIPTNRRDNGFTAPGAVRWVREMLREPRPNLPPEWFDRLYISREGAQTRRVVNERDFFQMLIRYGFNTVRPERFDLKDQIKMFSMATHVISAHGAGLTNAIFADNPTLIELGTPAYTNPCYYLLAEGMGWDYHYLECQNVGEEDLYVNKDTLSTLLADLGKGEKWT